MQKRQQTEDFIDFTAKLVEIFPKILGTHLAIKHEGFFHEDGVDFSLEAMIPGCFFSLGIRIF